MSNQILKIRFANQPAAAALHDSAGFDSGAVAGCDAGAVAGCDSRAVASCNSRAVNGCDSRAVVRCNSRTVDGCDSRAVSGSVAWIVAGTEAWPPFFSVVIPGPLLGVFCWNVTIPGLSLGAIVGPSLGPLLGL